MRSSSLAGLVLMGGGARAAYQVGVLQAMAGLLQERNAARRTPFPIVVGTSAGAINASALACGAADFVAAVEELAAVWSQLRVEQVFRADSLGVIRSGARWLTLLSLGWLLTRWWRQRPRSLLDNRPLAALLHRRLDLRRIDWALRHHHLHALAVTASSYSSGQHVTFYQACRPIEPWSRSQRLAESTRLTHSHLLASAAIPFVFPAVPLQVQGQREYFGDGSMRQTAPISPAVHLGAQRILVIGAGRLQEPPGPRAVCGDYPSLAQIAGHALSNIFLDALAVDVERARRINHTLSLLSPEARERTSLRPLDLLVIAPSQRLDDLAAGHVAELPAPIRALLRALGVHSDGQSPGEGAALVSYLLFEPGYVHALMELGRQDTLARRAEVEHFLGLAGAQASEAAT
ncbi:MAG: patatin [Caldimonas sp.]|uniref:patatin-like phospholipase family protein n=1 Tax=Caldimonas taiwanensis TaxID=307483 RepID=UPI000780DF41|nr:patatin-like phospholipase family protein [Caldimonas taiwanensis]GIX24373.1 MAG: patatin [Caldimonas sp.]